MSETLKTTLFIVLAVYAVMGTGAVCGKAGWLNPRTRKDLLAIVINVLIPCMIVKNVLMNPVFKDPKNLYGPPLIGFSIILVSVLIGWIAARILPTGLTTLDSTRKIGTFAACLGMLNYGYVPIPLIEHLFPNNSGVLGVLFVQNVGTEFALWTVCVFSMLGRFDSKTVKSLFNIPVMVIVGCLLFDIFEPLRYLPFTWRYVFGKYNLDVLFWTPISMLATSAIPLSLLCVGGAIAEEFHLSDFVEDIGKTLRISAVSIFFRLLVFPCLILLAAKYIPVSREAKIVTVIYASMSSATFPIVLAETYDGDVKTALLTSLSNSFAAIATTPFWIAAGLKWVGIV